MRLTEYLRLKDRLAVVDSCYAPTVAAVYFVYFDEILLYVGRTTNLKIRIFSHEKRSEWLRMGAVFRWSAIPASRLEFLEKTLIFKLQPPHNVQLRASVVYKPVCPSNPRQ